MPLIVFLPFPRGKATPQNLGNEVFVLWWEGKVLQGLVDFFGLPRGQGVRL